MIVYSGYGNAAESESLVVHAFSVAYNWWTAASRTSQQCFTASVVAVEPLLWLLWFIAATAVAAVMMICMLSCISLLLSHRPNFVCTLLLPLAFLSSLNIVHQFFSSSIVPRVAFLTISNVSTAHHRQHEQQPQYWYNPTPWKDIVIFHNMVFFSLLVCSHRYCCTCWCFSSHHFQSDFPRNRNMNERRRRERVSHYASGHPPSHLVACCSFIRTFACVHM